MGFFQCLGNWFRCYFIIQEKEDRIIQLTNEIQGYQEQINYDFIPDNWNKSNSTDVLTNKTFQDGIQLNLDIRDLLNSTIYSRLLAKEVINKVQSSQDYDVYFNDLVLEAANLTIRSIKYKTNQEQFNAADRWNNGDTAIETGEGDCDLSTRVFIRVINDVLDKLKMFEYKKYVFQAIGFYTAHNKVFGHSWAIVYDPVDLCFKLIECTEDKEYLGLPIVPNHYDMYFCLNFKNIWYLKSGWRNFL